MQICHADMIRTAKKVTESNYEWLVVGHSHYFAAELAATLFLIPKIGLVRSEETLSSQILEFSRDQ